MERQSNTYDRETLYRQVWEAPLIKVAQQYGVSGVAIGKTCRKLGIPLPGRGYWAKKAAGGRTKILPLPPLKPGQPNVISTNHIVRPQPDPSRQSKKTIGDSANTQLTAMTSGSLKPHHLIKNTAKNLRRFSAEGHSIFRETACIDIRVSRSALNRATSLMDTLLKTMESKGLKVVVTEPGEKVEAIVTPLGLDKSSHTGIVLEGAFVPFGIDEAYLPESTWSTQVHPNSMADRITYVPCSTSKRVGTGELILRIRDNYGPGVRLTWRDGKRQKLEAMVADIVNGIHDYAIAKLQAHKNYEDRRLVEEENRRRYLEEQRQIKEEKARIFDLESRAADWHKVVLARDFISAVDETLTRGDYADELVDDVTTWLAWAKAHVRQLEAEALFTITVRREPPKPRYSWENS